MMGKILIVTEKTSVACKLGSTGRKMLGDFKMSNGEILTDEKYSADENKYKKMFDNDMGYIENDKYIIAPASGHLFELYQAYDYNPNYRNWSKIPFPFIPNTFEIKLKEDKKTKSADRKAKKCYDIIKKLMDRKDVESLICATDGDREGENIFSLIYQFSGCRKPVMRLWTDAWEENDVIKALKNIKPWKEYENLKKAGFCRMCSDWQMGANLTAKTTLALTGGKEIVSVGRVQTAVLNEIVQRELAILNFNSKKFYKIIGKFRTKDGQVYEGIYDDEVFEDDKKANSFLNIIKKESAKVNKYDEKKENKYCPPLYDQTGLAVDMARNGIDPDKTLEISQSLYESGYQTYPRTASRYIMQSEAGKYSDMLKEVAKINPLSIKYPFNASNKRIVDDSKVESHSAITPTINVPDINKLTNEQRMVYETVIKRAIAVTFPPAVELSQVAETGVGEYPFKSSGRKELERGWREVYDMREKDNAMPVLKKGEGVEIVSLEVKEVIPQPPKRYDKASILVFMDTCGKKIENEEMRELMKNKGIGTSATRANILSRLFEVKYIEEKGKSIAPTEKGMNMIQKFPVDELKNAEFTGQLEYELYRVEKGEIPDTQYMKMINDLYSLSCQKLSNQNVSIPTVDKDEIGKCPCCQHSVVHKKGKNKATGKEYDFYGCTNYKGGCKFTINSIVGNKKITEKQVQTLLEKRRTGIIKGFTDRNGDEFDAKLVLNDKNEVKFE